MNTSNSSVRPALKTYPIRIKEKIQETKDSFSFVFEVPQEYSTLFMYTPAQFLTFEFKIKEESFLRSYSLSSCPFLKEELKTTVKRVPGGVVSNYMIDHLKPGDTILSRKPAGRFFKPPKDLKPKSYFLFAGGSGITPLFSIIKTALFSDPKNKVLLLYANRDKSSIIYHKELNALASHYKSQFNITHILSREKTPESNFYGRLTTEHLKKYFLNIQVADPNQLYYLCGPLGFMQTLQNFLIEKQAKKSQIRKESFFTLEQKKLLENTPLLNKKNNKPEEEKEENKSSEKQEQAKTKAKALSQDKEKGNYNIDKKLIENKEAFKKKPEVSLKGKEDGGGEKAKPEIIRAFFKEEVMEIKALPDIPILEQLLSAGHSPPFSCLSGSCMSCLALLKKGQISQEERGILEDENIEKHEILSCQALPESRIVEVDYDI